MYTSEEKSIIISLIEKLGIPCNTEQIPTEQIFEIFNVKNIKKYSQKINTLSEEEKIHLFTYIIDATEDENLTDPFMKDYTKTLKSIKKLY